MTICGFTGLTETGRRGVMDPTRGVTLEIRYAGPTEAVLAALPSLQGSTSYVEFDVTNPPVGTLLIRTPDWEDDSGSSTVQTTFDLIANLAQKSGYEHPRSIAIGTDGDDGLTAIAAKVGQDGASATDFTAGDSRTLFEMMTAGQDTFFQSQFVFRWSRHVSRNASVSVAYDDTNKIYTSNAMIAETGATSLFQTAIREAYDSVSDFYGSVPSGHTLGWLKQAPQTTGVAGNRAVITVEYYLDAWRNYYYV
jgi:hypothetical protein